MFHCLQSNWAGGRSQASFRQNLPMAFFFHLLCSLLKDTFRSSSPKQSPWGSQLRTMQWCYQSFLGGTATKERLPWQTTRSVLHLSPESSHWVSQCSPGRLQINAVCVAQLAGGEGRIQPPGRRSSQTDWKVKVTCRDYNPETVNWTPRDFHQHFQRRG